MTENMEMPCGWAKVTLSNVCAKITDGSHFSPKSVDTGFPYVTVKDLKNDAIDFSNCLKISIEDYNNLRNNDCNPLRNDVLFSKDGTVGKVALVNYDLQFVVLSSLAILRPHPTAILSNYLFHILKSSQFLLQALKRKKGVAIRRIILRDLKEIGLNLPPLPEQHRIVAKIEELFSELDKGVEALKTSQQQLKVYRQAVLKWAFEGKLTNTENQISTVPFGTVIEIVSGNTPKGLSEVSNTGEYQFYKVSDMNLDGNEVEMRKSNICLTRSEIAKLKIKLYPRGTVIFPKRGGAILTNKKRILLTESSFDLNLMGALPNEKVSEKYLFYWFQKLDLGKIYDGSNVPQINNKNINPLEFPICSIKQQLQIVQEIESRLSVADKIEESIAQSLKQAEALRQSILKKAFSGKLVPQDPNDEPADKLLARIQAERAAQAPERSRRRALR